MLRKMMFWAVVPSIAPSAQTAKINFCDPNNQTVFADWNNFTDTNTGTVATALKNSEGVLNGWSLVTNNFGSAGIDGFSSPNASNVDFPDDVIRTEWYIGANNTSYWNFAGLTPGKSYTIKTMSYDPGDVKTTFLTWGGLALSCSPYNNPSQLTFPNLIADANGQIAGSWFGDGATGNPIINAIIINEN